MGILVWGNSHEYNWQYASSFQISVIRIITKLDIWNKGVYSQSLERIPKTKFGKTYATPKHNARIFSPPVFQLCQIYIPMNNLLYIILHTVGYSKTPFAYLGSCFLLALSLHTAQLTGRTPEIIDIVKTPTKLYQLIFCNQSSKQLWPFFLFRGPRKSWQLTMYKV